MIAPVSWNKVVRSFLKIIIADFKTNKRPPANFDDVPQAYKEQMSIYYELIKNIYPNHLIRSMLIWTEGPKIIQFPDSYLSRG